MQIFPYTNYTKNSIAEYEGYYASVTYAYLASLGFPIVAEDVTNRGRVDLSIFVDNKAYIIEFKVAGKECEALQQIKERRYYEKYQDKEVILIGICFDPSQKNISRWEWEIYGSSQ